MLNASVVLLGKLFLPETRNEIQFWRAPPVNNTNIAKLGPNRRL